MKKLDMLFFDPPIFANGLIPRHKLANDNQQNREVPRGMLCIASFLQKKGIKARLVIADAFFSDPIEDLLQLNQKVEDLISFKVREYNPDFIGFGMMFGFNEKVVRGMVRFTKKNFPHKKIIIGGNHATFSASRLLRSGNEANPDIVVRGEGERAVYEIIKGRKFDDISGISFQSDKEIIHNPQKRPDSILDLPSNDYSLIDLGEGIDIAHFNHMVQYMRGCSFGCAFCTNKEMWGQKSRPHNGEAFYAELSTILRLYDRIKEPMVVVFMDDNVLSSSSRWWSLFSYLEKAKREHPKAQFAAQARVSSVRKDDKEIHNLLKSAKKAGIAAFFLGIESGSQPILDGMNKHCRVEWIEPACRNIKNHGIAVGGFWMFGHPGATLVEEERSLVVLEDLFSKKLLDYVELHMTIPFPGTLMRKDPRVRLLFSEEEEVERYSVFNESPIHCLIDPSDGKIVMSAEEIIQAYEAGIGLKKHYLDEGEAVITYSSPSHSS